MDLKDLKSPADIRGLSIEELRHLADELRSALLTKLSRHGGHVGPNLGMVEATIALHYVFNTPVDKLVFDVSHQSYVHKMLTGRIEAFIDPAHYDDVTGYTEPRESEYDLFAVGHTSTSIAMATGIAKGRDLQGGHENVIAVIGDGSLSGGEAYEGLDYAATLGSNFIVVVNDNDMSIAPNHGGIYANLRELRETNGQCPTNLFRAIGFDYRFVKDGNDLDQLIRAFLEVKDIDHPVVVHIATQKGMGYEPAEADREEFHWSVPFDEKTGRPLSISETQTYDELMSDYMLDKMKKDPRVVAITAATPGVFGFTPEKRAKAGKQFVDVGIAEAQAAGMSSGLAKIGQRPVFMVGSSFSQRAYDQISQDISINNQPVTIAIFYGGMFGLNDVTHLGWFDIALYSNVPGVVYLAPTCGEEYMAMLDWAINQEDHPVVVRVPGGGGPVNYTGRAFPSDYSKLNVYDVRRRGTKVALIAEGEMFARAEKAADILKEKGVEVTLISPRYLSGVDEKCLDDLKKDTFAVFTYEDGIIDGGFGQKVASYYGPSGMKVINRGLPKEFLDAYDRAALARVCRFDPDQIADDVLAELN